MYVVDKESHKAEERSMSLNSEKDFKELIDEIDKVRNQNSSNSETDEKSKELNSDSVKSLTEEEKSFSDSQKELFNIQEMNEEYDNGKSELTNIGV